MSRFRLQLAAAAIFLLAWTKSASLEGNRQAGILPIDPPTPYRHYLPEGLPRGRVLVVHGLDVSKEVMSPVSAALADAGFEVYAIDLPGHGDSRTAFKTDLAEQAIRNAATYLGEDTIVLGHSMGAGMLLDLAGSSRFSTMVLLSPPPLSIAEVHADRVLIATGAIDIPRILAFVPIAADIGGVNVESWILPWGGHSAPIFGPANIRRVVEWLGGDGGGVRTRARMLWWVVMFLAAVLLGKALMPVREGKGQPMQIPGLLANYAIACGAALVILKFVTPLGWLRLFATDYLASFLLLVGLGLLGSLLRRRGSAGKILGKSPIADFVKAIGAAAYVILVPGLLAASNVLHMTLSDGRWWRFPCIIAAGLPFFLADEWMTRGIQSRWKSIGVALVTRGLLLAFVLTGVLVLNRENAFLVLLAPLIAIFWLALWFASGVVYRHTRDLFATALFAAIVQGWAFAAWFVTI